MPLGAEQFANDPVETTITTGGGINDSVQSFTVASGAGFPAAGVFRVKVDAELMIVTSRVGNTFNVLRGQEGSSPASHAQGAIVTHVLTAYGLLALGTRILLLDQYGNQPPAGLANRLFLPSNGFVLAHDNGDEWRSFGPLYKLKPPTNMNSFTWVNQGSAFLTDQGAMYTLSDNGFSGTANYRMRVKTAPSTPYSIIAYMVCDIVADRGNLGYGFVWRNSSSGNFVTYGWKTGQWRVFKFITPTSENLAYTSYAVSNGVPPWVRIDDDGTNRKCLWSFNGIKWILAHSVSRTDFITPDQIGIYVNAGNNASPLLDVNLNIHSWEEHPV